MPVLYISIYEPIWGNTPHWALKLVATNHQVFYLQVFGEHGTYEFHEATGKDPVTASHREDIKIWDVSAADVPRVRAVARNKTIDNETVMWSCQDWCMEVIQELEEDFIVGVEDDGDAEDLEEWQRLKDELVEKMGPDL